MWLSVEVYIIMSVGHWTSQAKMEVGDERQYGNKGFEGALL